MKATARRAESGSYTHHVHIRDHRLTVDEPTDHGGADQGPHPQEIVAASLASCVAITIEMYAERKGWDLGFLEVSCEYEQAPPGETTEFSVTLRLPDDLDPEQVERLKVIAGKCPVHRTLEGPVAITEQVELMPADQL